MSDIRNWSKTAASNTDATNGGMPLNMAPSDVDNNVRTQIAAHRTQWEDAEWFDWGHLVQVTSNTEFTVSNSVTTVYSIGRRLKFVNGATTLYGHVISISSVAANNTKFTVSLGSGTLTSTISAVSISILDPTNTSIPKGLVLDAPSMTGGTISGTTINGTIGGTGNNGYSIQTVNTQVSTNLTGTTSIPIDGSVPQNTEGTEIMSLAITPVYSTSKLKIDVVVYMGSNTSNASNAVALFQDTTANALAAVAHTIEAGGGGATCVFTHYMTAGTTSSTTFKVRIGTNLGTWAFNGGGSSPFGGVEASSITITEIKA